VLSYRRMENCILVVIFTFFTLSTSNMEQERGDEESGEFKFGDVNLL
jgi:hypothetical protein